MADKREARDLAEQFYFWCERQAEGFSFWYGKTKQDIYVWWIVFKQRF